MSFQGEHNAKVSQTVQSTSAAAKSRLAASWHRSMVFHGLDPADLGATGVEAEAEIDIRKERMGNLLQIAAPKIDHLFELVGNSGCGIVLTDCDGVILDQRFTDADTNVFNEWGLRVGADWSESSEGTNGIGTCLVELRNVIIHRDQHFMAKNIGMSCIDAPIFGAEGELLGALDVSSARVDQTEAINHLISAMVAETARKIEFEVFQTSYADERIVVADYDGAEGAVLLAVDANDIVVGATRAARKAFGLSSNGAIEAAPASDVLGRKGTEAGFEKAEKAALVRALTRSKGNVSHAAKALGISRATMYRRMKRLGLLD